MQGPTCGGAASRRHAGYFRFVPVPGWFLLAVRRSGLFTRRVIRTATAMVWFYAGADRDRRALAPRRPDPRRRTDDHAESLSERGDWDTGEYSA